MWTLNCGCGLVSTEHFEFNITDDPINSMLSIDFELPNKTDNIECLKEKVILDYLEIIKSLECGILPDLEGILEDLSLLDIKFNGSINITKKVYSNNDIEDDYLMTLNHLSEFDKDFGKKNVKNNLNIDDIKHKLLSRLEYENLNNYLENTLYFVLDYE